MLLLVSLGCVFLYAVLTPAPTVVYVHRARQLEAVLTPTYSVYLPAISHEIACVNPPSGTVMIGGQAPVHGQPARAGIPFPLEYTAHWDIRPYYILTATTCSDGRFCSGPVDMLIYPHPWYVVVFNPEWVPDEGHAAWASPRLVYGEIEAGRVYTFGALKS